MAHPKKVEYQLQRELYKKSPYFLGKHILGFKKFCETHIEWDEWFEDIFTFFPQKRAFALKLAPRETFKSTFFVVSCAISALLINPNLTILIAGETQGNAEAHLKEIKSKIESEDFKIMFGNLKSDAQWNNEAINISTRNLFTKEASIEAAGVGKSLTGKHYDLIIADDLVGSEDRDSAAKRKMTFDFFNGLFDVLKKESGQLLMTGTRWHREDLYSHIENKIAPDLEKKGIGKFHISCVPAHDKTTGALNYPRLLPENRLTELKTVKQGKDGIDISTYMAQYELDPLSPEDQIFKTLHYYNHTDVKFETFIQWTDPALSEKASACYSSIIVLGKIVGEPYYGVAYASLDRRAPQKIKLDHNRIAKMHQDLYGVPTHVFMENNGFQVLLAKAASNESNIATVGRHNSENKLARIRGMEPYISQGFIRFRSDWETAPENYRLLLEQLLSFPQGKIDGPDALQSAHNEANKGFNYCRTITAQSSSSDSENEFDSSERNETENADNKFSFTGTNKKGFNFLENI